MRIYVYETGRGDGERIHIDLDCIQAISIKREVARKDLRMPGGALAELIRTAASLTIAMQDKRMELSFRHAEVDGVPMKTPWGDPRADRFDLLLAAWKGKA